MIRVWGLATSSKLRLGAMHYDSTIHFTTRIVRFLLTRLLIGLLLAGATGLAVADDVKHLWQSSPHANSESEAFRHWDDEGEVPTTCATCHSMPGFLDYLGADGSESGIVEHPAPVDTVLGCDTCHNDAVGKQESVVFPSGATVTKLGSSFTCAVCHQGRQSTVDVNNTLADLPDDIVSADLEFLNVHYLASAATLFGNEVKGGYEYAGKQYTGRFAHPEPFDSCTGCHDPHALTVKAEDCSACHEGVADTTLTSIRTRADDVDGDGGIKEGIFEELASLHILLREAIRLYGARIIDSPIVYSSTAYPYFFNDLDDNGTAEAEEITFPNRYKSWTPRLLRAAYNYQYFAKDPGAWAHNPTYAAQLMIDSIENLANQIDLKTPAFNRP